MSLYLKVLLSLDWTLQESDQDVLHGVPAVWTTDPVWGPVWRERLSEEVRSVESNLPGEVSLRTLCTLFSNMLYSVVFWPGPKTWRRRYEWRYLSHITWCNWCCLDCSSSILGLSEFILSLLVNSMRFWLYFDKTWCFRCRRSGEQPVPGPALHDQEQGDTSDQVRVQAHIGDTRDTWDIRDTPY